MKPVGTVPPVGGGARSEMWRRMKADLLGFPVKRPVCTEAALLGVAILAGKACGLLPDIETAIQRMVRLEQPLRPDDAARPLYLRAYGERCRQLA